MKEKKGFALLLAMLFAAAPMEAMAYEVPEIISVGLESVCKHASSATVSGETLCIGMEDDGDFEEGGMLAEEETYTVKPETGKFIAVDDEMDQRDAFDLAEELLDMDFDAYAAYLSDEDWTVYVKDASSSEVEEETGEDTVTVSDFTGFSLSGGDVSLLLPQDAVITGEDDTFQINGKRYRGMLTFVVSNNKLTAVNLVDLEDYLYGVVPAEMGKGYHAEALKAQAVAARTYAMTKLGAHRDSGYELCDTTNCQVYKGCSVEAETTTAAVDATRGEIACYDGKPIEAVFSASAGGYTENTENVWYAPVPYLRAVPELVAYEDTTWKKELTLDDLTELLEEKDENIGDAEDIVITKLSTGGRVQEMEIVGTRGTKVLTKDSIRTYFSAAGGSLPSKMFTINGKGGEIGGFVEADREEKKAVKSGSLMAAAAENGITVKAEGDLSRLNGKNLSVDLEVESGSRRITLDDHEYEVYDVDISTVKNDTFLFEGVGNGHGVGLSQRGALAMAQEGYDYEEILCHYYTGIEIEG
ncbi:MAG: SpoIID/LytB domain-containing protein [Bacillota bacterium]|nr:SpoIID/LytB domain-containing protein [Bacillota bacterium]